MADVSTWGDQLEMRCSVESFGAGGLPCGRIARYRRPKGAGWNEEYVCDRHAHTRD